jgi:NDP-sugar pyrophosphorylase family protein/lipopolysaccharide/colanic/teichoic acid biosynthesis glycosyltransferase
MIDAFIVATGERSGLSLLESRGASLLSGQLPAPLLPLLDRPVLVWIVEMLARQGVSRVLVAVNEAAGHVEQTLGDGKRWGITIEYVLQREPFGNAGAAKWAQRLLPEPFLLVPGDAYVDVDVAALVNAHQRQGARLTALAHGSGAMLRVNGGGRIQSRQEDLLPAGIYVLEPEALQHVPPRTPFDAYADLRPALHAAGEEVAAFAHEGYWNPLCTAEQVHQGQLDLLRSAGLEPALRLAEGLPRHVRLPSTQMAPGIWVGKHNVIHPLAKMMPPIFVGDDCRIGPNVELGPETILSSGVIVDEGATIHHSTILPHTYIGRLVDVGQRLVQQQRVTDLASGQMLEVVDEFLLAPAHPATVSRSARQLRDSVLAALFLWLLLPVLIPPALAALLSSGKALRRVERRAGPSQPARALWRLNTRRADGQLLPFGRFVERWGLQRLPALWNVIRGELALVGLMPLARETAEELDGTWLETRRDEPAGFTGAWFVQTTADSILDEALAADALYAATRSWQDDMRLLWRTPAAWWRQTRRNSATRGQLSESAVDW